MSLKYHNLTRDEDGWTWLSGSYTDPGARDGALERNKRSFPDQQWAPLDTENYDAARIAVRQINKKRKGREIK